MSWRRTPRGGFTLDTVITDTESNADACSWRWKGERFDAHDFADKAKANGAGALLVSRPWISISAGDCKSTRVRHWPTGRPGTYAGTGAVVALTGSSGKTRSKR